VPYADIVTRSFRIAWNHKYLWLIGLFSGESGGNAGVNYVQPAGRLPDVGALESWLTQNVDVVITVAVVSLVVTIAFFVVAAACEGATVRASAEHDAERPFGLSQAWALGVRTMWVVVRFRLVIFVLYLPLLAAAVAWVVALIAGLLREDAGLLLSALFAGLLLLLPFFAYAFYLFFLDRYGSRAVILEDRRALSAIGAAHRMLFKRFGRSLLVLVLSLAISFAIAVVVGLTSSILLLPLLAAAYSGSRAFWPILAVTAAVLVPVYLVVAGFLAAQSSTYWTLAFRRLDVDQGYPR
jgi:hypothetical protein